MNAACVFLAAFLVVIAAHPPGRSAEEQACWEAIKSDNKEDMREIITTCIAAQSGLQDIIDSLKPTTPEGGEGGRRPGGRGGHGGPGGPGGHRGGNPIKLLEDAGYTTEAETLMKCVSQAKGDLNEDGSFNVEGFQANLITLATAAEKLTEVQLGITNCPTSTLDAYNVPEYIKCIVSYCATGEAPTDSEA